MSSFVAEIRDSVRVVAANARLRRIAAVAVLAELSAPVFYTASMVWAFAEGGPMLTALFVVIAMVPAALVAPVAAVVTDRARRDLVIVSSLAARAGFLMVLAIGMALGSTWLFLGSAMIASMCARVLYPALAATLPAVTFSRRELVSANALVSTIENVGAVVGPALAAFALIAFSEAAVCVFAAVGTFAAAVAAARIGAVRTQREQTVDERSGSRSRVREVAAGFHSLCSNAGTRALATVHAVHAFSLGALGIVLVQVAVGDLRLGASGLGMLETALAVGGVAGGIVAVGRAGSGSVAGTVRVGAVLFALPLSLAAMLLAPSVAVVALALAGVANVLLDVVVYTHVQETTADAVLARAVAALQSATVLAVGLGGLVAGLALSSVGSRATLALLALWVPGAALMLVRRPAAERARGNLVLVEAETL